MHGKCRQGQKIGGGVTPTHSKLRRKKEAGGQHHAMAALNLWPCSHFVGDWVGLGVGLGGTENSASTVIRSLEFASQKYVANTKL